jgi:hypothetical protein
MAENSDKYKSRLDYDEIMKHSPDYSESLQSCCTDGGYSSILTVMALSTVIGKPIQTLYPQMNSETDTAPYALSKLFVPSGSEISQPLTILWSRMGPTNGKFWTPNHFVPVISNVHFIPKHFSTPDSFKKREDCLSDTENIALKTPNTDISFISESSDMKHIHLNESQDSEVETTTDQNDSKF